MTRQSLALLALQEFIRLRHDCEPTHVESIRVRAAVPEGIWWKNVVAVFTLQRHGSADKCFAWDYTDGARELKRAVVFATLSISTAEAAVRSYYESKR